MEQNHGTESRNRIMEQAHGTESRNRLEAQQRTRVKKQEVGSKVVTFFTPHEFAGMTRERQAQYIWGETGALDSNDTSLAEGRCRELTNQGERSG